MEELGFPPPAATLLYCDNNTAVLMASQPRFHSRAKHIRVAYHAVRDYVAHREIRLHYIPSKNNVADLLTKPLSRAPHEWTRSLIRMA